MGAGTRAWEWGTAGRRQLLTTLMAGALVAGCATPPAPSNTQAVLPTPTIAPTVSPTVQPVPTAASTALPSVAPTIAVTASSTASPTLAPSAVPSTDPTPAATASPRPSAVIRGPAWVTAGELHLGRPRTHAAAVAGGRVLVVGSDNVCTPGAAWPESVVAELGQPVAATWALVDELRSPRDKFVLAALPDGRALVTGGTTVVIGTAQNAAGPDSYSSTFVFNPSDGTWARSGLLNTARSDPAGAVLPDGRVLVAGGYYSDLPEEPPLRMLASSELWDPESGEWSRSGQLGQARYGAAMVVLADGRVLVVGGWPSVEEGEAPLFGHGILPLGTAEIFDPRSGRWSPVGELALARSDFVLVALPDGGAIVAGGRIYLDAGEFGYQVEPTDSVERFDPANGTWVAGAHMAVAAADRTGVVLADGRVLMAGGDLTAEEADLDATPPALTASAEIYDAATGIWTETIALPSDRAGASGVLMPDGTVVLAGGIAAHGHPADTPSCPAPEPGVLRYVPAP